VQTINPDSNLQEEEIAIATYIYILLHSFFFHSSSSSSSSFNYTLHCIVDSKPTLDSHTTRLLIIVEVNNT
jgi:hypothetical protein